jgi:3-oxoacyl-[acyl-carrier protein] reductase
MEANYVIIGGSHGIGEALASKLSGNIFSFSRTQGPGMWKPFDVLSDTLPVNDLPDVINGVLYCPGSINLKPFHLFKMEDFQNDLNVNTLGAVKVLQALYPRLKKAEQASVVLFSTVAVKKGMSFHASIALAKGAIEGLTRSLAIEWAPKIRVNAIAPSLVDTPLAAKITSNAKAMEVSVEKHPLKRIGQSAELAQVASFLLTPESSWITGQVLAVDGGLSIA